MPPAFQTSTNISRLQFIIPRMKFSVLYLKFRKIVKKFFEKSRVFFRTFFCIISFFEPLRSFQKCFKKITWEKMLKFSNFRVVWKCAPPRSSLVCRFPSQWKTDIPVSFFYDLYGFLNKFFLLTTAVLKVRDADNVSYLTRKHCHHFSNSETSFYLVGESFFHGFV